MKELFWTSYAVLWLLVVFESLLVLGLLRELGRIYLLRPESIARDGLPLGASLPKIEVNGRRAGRTVLTELLRAPYTLVVCALPDCPLCGPVIEAAQRWSRHRSHIATVVLVSGQELGALGAIEDSEAVLANAQAVLQELEVRASPFVYVASADGTILAKGLVNNHRDIRALLANAGALGRTEERSDSRQGEPAYLGSP